MSVWASVWTRPGHATYGQKIGQLPADGGVTVGYSGVGAGNLTLPREYPRLSEILSLDPVTPANGEWSTIRVFSESGWLYDWLPTPRNLPPDKNTPGINISGFGIEGVLGFARVEPWDWDGSTNFASAFPNWIYGGRNVLSNPGFEENQIVPLSYELTVTATGGDYTLTDGTDTTSAIAFNASPATIQTRLQTDIAAITDVVVAQVSGIYIITFVEPPYSTTISINTGGLTGGSATLLATQDGGQFPNPWTKAAPLVNGLPKDYGNYDNFGVSDVEAHSGSFSLLVDPGPITATGNRNPGAQQVISVTPGGIYQAAVWVFPTSATNEFRLGIFGIGEEIIAFDANGVSGGSLTPNVWTQLTISDVVIPDNVSRIILRLQSTLQGPIDPAVFYIDDGEFNEGLAPNTVGFIFRELYEDATVDHAGRVVWEDEANPGTAYLNLDFSDTLDSDGAAWADTLSITFKPRMTYLHVMEQFARLGYEWRIVPDSIIAGTYLLQIYNAGTLGGIVAAGIVAGSSDIVRDARLLAPKATDIMVQAANDLYSHDNDAGAQSAFGRIEGSVLDQNLTSLTDAALVATDSLDAAVTGAESLVYTLRNPQLEPLFDYRPGDEITLSDPGVVSGARRVAQIVLAWDKSGPEYTVSLGSVVLTGQAAVNQAVDEILSRFQRPDPFLDAQAATVGGQGGMMTVALAAGNASDLSKSKADFICDGTDDHLEIMQAMAICYAAGGGTVWLSEGDFTVTGDQIIVGYSIAYPEPIILRGLGYGTNIRFDFFSQFVVYEATNCRVLDLNITPLSA